MLIYTDGSCVKNRKGGWCFLIVDYSEDEHLVCSGGETDTTNNRMELQAVIEALKYIVEESLTVNCCIHTDSKLTMYCGMKKWKRNKNLDLWSVFDHYNKSVNIDWKWVKAHNGNHYNEMVDTYARTEAENV